MIKDMSIASCFERPIIIAPYHKRHYQYFNLQYIIQVKLVRFIKLYDVIVYFSLPIIVNNNCNNIRELIYLIS